MKVKDIMQTRLTKITPQTSVEEAAKIMVTQRVGALLIEIKNEIKGIVTQGDIVTKVIAKEKKSHEVFVNEIQNTPLVLIDENADILDAVDIMAKYGIRRLAVINGGKIVGIVSSKVVGQHMRQIIKEYK